MIYTNGMGTWKSKNRHKYLLQYHIIFVCKYRNKLLMSKQRSDVELVTTEVENWDSYDMVFIGYPKLEQGFTCV